MRWGWWRSALFLGPVAVAGLTSLAVPGAVHADSYPLLPSPVPQLSLPAPLPTAAVPSLPVVLPSAVASPLAGVLGGTAPPPILSVSPPAVVPPQAGLPSSPPGIVPAPPGAPAGVTGAAGTGSTAATTTAAPAQAATPSAGRDEPAHLSLGFTNLPVPRAFTPEVVALMLLTLIGLLVLAGVLVWRGSQRRRELAMLNEAKQELLRLASHEFRTPLSVLTGYVSMLDQGDLGPVSPQLAAVVPVLSAKAREMEAMVEKMLDASRAVAAEIGFKPVRIALADVVRRGLPRLEPLGMAQRLDLHVAAEPVWVDADARILAGAIANLLENALKYSEGTVHCRVEARARRACVEVIDSGPGISLEQQRHLFALFGRVPRGQFSHVSGAGVGLYLAARMAHLHRGRIVVESEPGRGSVFRLEIPLAGRRLGRRPQAAPTVAGSATK